MVSTAPKNPHGARPEPNNRDAILETARNLQVMANLAYAIWPSMVVIWIAGQSDVFLTVTGCMTVICGAAMAVMWIWPFEA
jgi:hypothetical protein